MTGNGARLEGMRGGKDGEELGDDGREASDVSDDSNVGGTNEADGSISSSVAVTLSSCDDTNMDPSLK